jgi:hypothetical protein
MGKNVDYDDQGYAQGSRNPAFPAYRSPAPSDPLRTEPGVLCDHSVPFPARVLITRRTRRVINAYHLAERLCTLRSRMMPELAAD